MRLQAEGTATFRSAQDLLALDPARETERVSATLFRQVCRVLRRKGVVVGLSGGVDSSVAAALCVRAFGPARVLGLMMPEAESAPESRELATRVADQLQIQLAEEDLTPTLQAAGCYARRDQAIRSIVPAYGPGDKAKLVRRKSLDDDRYSLFSLVVASPDGTETQTRLTSDAYLAVVAATNFKQRIRKAMEYHYADRYQYAVVGTANRLEHDQGFFVKNGDGAADVRPLSHLYKTQVYQLAEYLGIPEEIRRRRPTTDTFPLAQSQEEFYFSVPYQTLDLCLYGLENALPVADVAAALGLRPEQVERVIRDIQSKRRATEYLRAPALVVADDAAR